MREVTELRPKAPVPSLARQTPRSPFPYRVVDVKVQNAAAQLLLAGTLTDLPPGSGRHPTAPLHAGADDPPAATAEESFAPEALERIDSWLAHILR